MTKSTSIADESKAALAGKKPRRTRGLHGRAPGHVPNDSTLVHLAIRLTGEQAGKLGELSEALMMSKADLIRRGVDLGIEWASARLKKLGAK